jgi:hypothetical protein
LRGNVGPAPVVRALVLAALALGAVPAPARAGGNVDPRNSADVYERNKGSLADVLLHVVKDLKVRAESWTKPGTASPAEGSERAASRGAPAPAVGGTLLIVVDPTTSMKAEMTEMREALDAVAAEGPRGLEIGVQGVAAEWTPPGPVSAAKSALAALGIVPFDGPKNLLEAVRDAATTLPAPADRPRAVVLVSKEGGDGEDDVEATRSCLEQRGIAFYSVAREAAFERPWDYDGTATTVPDLGITQRWNPTPRKGVKGELFYGGDVAFGLVPYKWELRDAPLAQTEFYWTGGGRFPVPSGFGYWALASLAWSTGGRCFVYNFRAPGARSREQDRNLTLYDLGFLNLFAPDLRPRGDVERALSQDRRAVAIVRIWEHLADDEAPLVLDHGSLERSGQSLVPRPMLPVRSSTLFDTNYATWAEVTKAKEVARERWKRAEQALSWWTDVEKRETTPSDVNTDPLKRRVEADFDLLGAQLQKVRFHWGEIRAALDTIKPDILDAQHRVMLVPVPLAAGTNPTRVGAPLPDEGREAAFVDLMATLKKIAARYRQTPWGLIVERGSVATIQVRTIDLRPDPRPEPPRDQARPDPSRPPPPKNPPPPPPPPERPGSGSGSSTTGK